MCRFSQSKHPQLPGVATSVSITTLIARNNNREKKSESEFNIFHFILSQYDLRGGTTTEKVKQCSSELSKSRVEVLTRQNTKERDAHTDPI